SPPTVASSTPTPVRNLYAAFDLKNPAHFIAEEQPDDFRSPRHSYAGVGVESSSGGARRLSNAQTESSNNTTRSSYNRVSYPAAASTSRQQLGVHPSARRSTGGSSHTHSLNSPLPPTPTQQVSPLDY